MSTPLRRYLRLLGALTLLSGVGQLVFPAEVAGDSAWGLAPGWQREIAFWNLAVCLIIARTLRANDAVGSRNIAIGLIVLQFMVASNHAVAAMQSHTVLNAIMSVVNYACVVFGAVALRVRT